MSASGTDPRLDPAEVSDGLIVDDLEARPTVGRPGGGLPTAVMVGLFALGGVGVFAWMNARREARLPVPIAEVATAPTGLGAATGPAPLELPPSAAQTTGPLFNVPAPQFTTNNTAPVTPSFVMPPGAPMTAAALPGSASDPLQRRRAPALVVDFGSQEAALPVPPNPALVPPAAAGAGKPDAVQVAEANAISAEERFADRIGQAGTERARATTLRNLDTMVPQGAMIPAVLETAINSDLPGFTRAVVSRDVMSFDGRSVLIPKGSRLIGQYKSGIALGASRVFVIWSRVIRPDGVSVEIGSPGADDLGRAGLSGKVDRHFFQRFGGSILLSVLNGGIMALANSGRDGAQVYIASPTDASNVASQALQKDGGTPPTVKTPQGAQIRVFVARDLDFSGVARISAKK